MMYSEGFVVSIRNSKGDILRESNGNVYLPFDSEYSLFIKNSYNRRAYASIKIDGTDVLSGKSLLIPAYGRISLERFCIDGDLSNGKKFLFVEENDSRVQDPTSSNNGGIEVSFRLEKDIKERYGNYHYSLDGSAIWSALDKLNDTYISDYYLDKLHGIETKYNWTMNGERIALTSGTPVHIDYDHIMKDGKYIPLVRDPDPNNYGYIYNETCSEHISKQNNCIDFGQYGFKYDNSLKANITRDTVRLKKQPAGATIEGSNSFQKFATIYDDVDLESRETIIKLQILPSKEDKTTVKETKYLFCTKCGAKAKWLDNFCSKCGTVLSRPRSLRS